MDNSALIKSVGLDLSHKIGPREDMVLTIECVTPSGDQVRLPLSADCALTLLNRMRIFERQYHRTNRRTAAPTQSALNALSAPIADVVGDEITEPRRAAS